MVETGNSERLTKLKSGVFLVSSNHCFSTTQYLLIPPASFKQIKIHFDVSISLSILFATFCKFWDSTLKTDQNCTTKAGNIGVKAPPQVAGDSLLLCAYK